MQLLGAVQFLKNYKSQVVAEQEVQKPDSTPPRGGNRVCDNIFHNLIPFLTCNSVSKATKQTGLQIRYKLAQTAGVMNNYLVPRALNGYSTHI
jgi:hypothetical protein